MVNTPPTGTTPAPTTADIDATRRETDALRSNTDERNKNTDSVSRSVEAMTNWNTQISSSRNLLATLTGGFVSGTSALGELNSEIGKLSGFMNNLDRSADLSISQMTKFGVAVTAAFGATQSFRSGNFEGLNTFTGQLEGILAPIEKDRGALQILANQMGIVLPKSVKDSASAIADFIRNTATSADNAIKLEDVYVKAAAATGRLGDVHEQAGVSLEHMNRMVRDQRSNINETIIATNLSKDTVEAYYQQISQLPIAMKGEMDSSTAARGATDQLTKTIQLARGTGRDFRDVVDDMKVAINDYNASIPEAMKFTAQISEVSQKYNIQVDDVRKSLTSTAGAFKMFGNEAEGAANILNEYVGQLKATGLSGQVATDIVTNMTSQIGNLNIAQKAFLSAQSGGPGGLMGAYNIDMKLRQGKIDEVFNMTKNQLTKMMGGNLVSTEQAANSPQAAAQMTKQIMMLRQGPLGQFARTDAEAERIIDALKGGRTSDIKPLLDGQKAVDNAAKLGNDYAKQSATGISKMVAIMEQARGEATGANLNLLQAGFTAGSGTEFEDQNLMAVQTRKAELSDTMAGGAAAMGRGASTQRVLENASNLIAQVPDELKSAIEGIGSLTSGEGANEHAMAFAKQYAEQTRAERAGASSLTGAAKEAEMRRLDQRDAMVKRATDAQVAAVKARENDTTLPDFMKAGQTSELGVPIVSSGSRVGVTAAGVASRRSAELSARGSPLSSGGGNASSDRSNPLGEIVVKVEGYCIHCKEKIEGSEHREAVSVGSKIPQ